MMIHHLGPYPTMKDSGMPWLGEVPEHWMVRRIKTLFRERDDRSSDGAGLLLSLTRARGLLPQSEASNRLASADDLSKYKVCRPSDLVMNRMQAWSGMFAVSPLEGLVGPDYSVFEAIEPCGAKYFEHLFKTPGAVDQFVQASKGIGSGFNRLYTPDFGAIPIVVPPYCEQIAIIRFLGHADRRIRRYIQAKQKLIKLLEEQQQAITHEAVTGQINVRTGRPYPAYRSSDVRWLGTVPAHWEVMRVKQVSRVLRGAFTHRPRNDPFLYDGPYPFIQTSEVAGAKKKILTYRQTLNERGLAASRKFPAGTLVMTIAANIGSVVVLDFDACFPDSVVGFVPRKRIERDFLYYVFRTMKTELLREAPVNTQGNLNVDRVGSQSIPIPSCDEQQAIVRQIETTTVRLDAAIRHIECGVDLLREFRTRLIADAVAGKLDVRDVAAGLPEIDPLATDDSLVGGNATGDGSNSEGEIAVSDRNGLGNLARERDDPEEPEVRA